MRLWLSCIAFSVSPAADQRIDRFEKTILTPRAPDLAVLMLALSRQVQLCVSAAIFAEYDEVIRRPHLKRAPDVIEGALQSIRKLAQWVEPSARVRECSDPDDNIFLECALAASAVIWSPATNAIFPTSGRSAVANANGRATSSMSRGFGFSFVSCILWEPRVELLAPRFETPDTGRSRRCRF